MRRLIDRCAGIDVGRRCWWYACGWSTGREADQEIRSFGATTPDLVEMRDWLPRPR